MLGFILGIFTGVIIGMFITCAIILIKMGGE